MLSTGRIVTRWGAERSIEKQQTINQTGALDFGNDTLFEDLDDVALDVESANNEKKINFHELQLTSDDDFDSTSYNIQSAKCASESSDLNSLNIHLKSVRGTNDGRVFYITFLIQLSFAKMCNKTKLLRHLQYHHTETSIPQGI
uniref:Uncharacterized protein n=1 Tax=Glossina austeni TaxID=7395 RepID=A0A1A9USG2_GLOAU